jgi:hypothetical protein
VPRTPRRKTRIPQRERPTAGPGVDPRDSQEQLTPGLAEPRGAEVVPISEGQKVFDEADAALGEDIKATYGVEPFARIIGDHPGEWIAFLPREIGAGLRILSARLLAHHPQRQSVEAQVNALRQWNPGVSATIRFSDEYLAPENG